MRALCGFPVIRGNHHGLCMLPSKHGGSCLPVPTRIPRREN